MKTIPEILTEVAAENYPGSTFSPEVHRNAADLLERDTRTRALRALRKAVVQYRPPSTKPVPKLPAPSPAGGSSNSNPKSL